MSNLSDKFATAATSDQDTGTTTDDDQGLLFIGEGKKYANQEEADKAIGFKEEHITRIEQENAELRDKVQKSATLDDVLDSIQNQRTVEDQSSQTDGNDHQNTDIDALVARALDEKLVQHDTQKKAEANSQLVVDTLTKQYGEKAGEMYDMKAQELGVNLDDLAATSPKAVLEFFKEAPRPTVGSYTGGTVNTSHLNQGGTEHGTYEYWTKQIKAGTITRDKGFAAQHKSLQAMGAAKFYGNS